MDDRLLLKDKIFYLFEAISIISGLFQYIKHQTELGNHGICHPSVIVIF
jgi:hypothetical protein